MHLKIQLNFKNSMVGNVTENKTSNNYEYYVVTEIGDE